MATNAFLAVRIETLRHAVARLSAEEIGPTADSVVLLEVYKDLSILNGAFLGFIKAQLETVASATSGGEIDPQAADECLDAAFLDNVLSPLNDAIGVAQEAEAETADNPAAYGTYEAGVGRHGPYGRAG